MKISIDTAQRKMTLEEAGESKVMELHSKEAFEAISRVWVQVGWSEKYQYSFSWMGRPIIQLPEDRVRMQEVVFKIQPDVIIETGVAHGGSLIFYASLCKAIGKGRVIGIDVEIRPHNRAAIESHPMNDRISLVEGSSTSAEIVSIVRSQISVNEKVLVILDSNHTYNHVAEELRLYSGMVTVGSYIVATDGIMSELADVPRGLPEWKTDNPTRAAKDFADRNPNFRLEQLEWPFNESKLDQNITHWPGAWLRRASWIEAPRHLAKRMPSTSGLST